MQRTKFPSRQETAALGSSATDLPGPPQKRLLPVDPEFIPKKTTHAFSHRREEAWVFYEFAMLKGKRCPHTAQKMGYVRTKKNSGELRKIRKRETCDQVVSKYRAKCAHPASISYWFEILYLLYGKYRKMSRKSCELPTTEVVGFYPYGRLFSYLTSLIQRLQPLML